MVLESAFQEHIIKMEIGLAKYWLLSIIQFWLHTNQIFCIIGQDSCRLLFCWLWWLHHITEGYEQTEWLTNPWEQSSKCSVYYENL